MLLMMMGDVLHLPGLGRGLGWLYDTSCLARSVLGLVASAKGGWGKPEQQRSATKRKTGSSENELFVRRKKCDVVVRLVGHGEDKTEKENGESRWRWWLRPWH